VYEPVSSLTPTLRPATTFIADENRSDHPFMRQKILLARMLLAPICRSSTGSHSPVGDNGLVADRAGLAAEAEKIGRRRHRLHPAGARSTPHSAPHHVKNARCRGFH
jgi:hypothetical protein